MAENLYPQFTPGAGFQPISSPLTPETMTLDQLQRFMATPQFSQLPGLRREQLQIRRNELRRQANTEALMREAEATREDPSEFFPRSQQEMEQRGMRAAGILPPEPPPPAPPYTGPATPETPAATPSPPPPSPPRQPLPPREPARPGAPAAGLPPRIEMGEGNISELVSQRLGQIKPPEEAKSFLDNPYLALVQAGLSMMADSRGKSPLEAIAGGGRAGLQVAMDQRAAARAQEQRRYAQEMERLKAENEMRRALGEEAYRRASLGVTQRGQDVQARSQDIQSAIQERVADRQESIEQLRHSQAQAQALRDQVRDILKLADIEKDLALAAERSGDRAAAAEHRSRVNTFMREVERLRGVSRPSPESAVPATNQGTPAR